jgi:WD40 repeat protein
VTTGRLIRVFELIPSHPAIASVAISPDGHLVLTGSMVSRNHDPVLALWHVNKEGPIQIFSGHQDSITSLAFSTNGDRILSASADGTAIVWSTATGNQIRTFRVKDKLSEAGKMIRDGVGIIPRWAWSWNGAGDAVGFSQDGTEVLQATTDNKIVIWDVASGAAKKSLVGHSQWINAVAFSGDGIHVVSGDADGTMNIWNAESGIPLRRTPGELAPAPIASLSPDANRVISGGGVGPIVEAVGH